MASSKPLVGPETRPAPAPVEGVGGLGTEKGPEGIETSSSGVPRSFLDPTEPTFDSSLDFPGPLAGWLRIGH